MNVPVDSVSIFPASPAMILFPESIAPSLKGKKRRQFFRAVQVLNVLWDSFSDMGWNSVEYCFLWSWELGELKKTTYPQALRIHWLYALGGYNEMERAAREGRLW